MFKYNRPEDLSVQRLRVAGVINNPVGHGRRQGLEKSQCGS